MSTERYIWWALDGEKCEAIIYARSRFNPRLVAYRLEPCASTKGKKGKPHIGVTAELLGKPSLLTVHSVESAKHAAAMVEAAPRSLVRMIMSAAVIGVQAYAAKAAGTCTPPDEAEAEAQRRLDLRTRIYTKLNLLETETDPDIVMVNVRGLPGARALGKGLKDLGAMAVRHRKEMDDLRAKHEAEFRQGSNNVEQLAVPVAGGIARRIEEASGMRAVAGRPVERGILTRYAFAPVHILSGGVWREVDITLTTDGGVNLRYPHVHGSTPTWARSNVDFTHSGRLPLSRRNIKKSPAVAAPAGVEEPSPKGGQIDLI